jgi:hypothetical protein
VLAAWPLPTAASTEGSAQGHRATTRVEPKDWTASWSQRFKPLQCTECTDVLGLAKIIAAGLVEVEPGGMRELHWHPKSDELHYYIEGEDRLTVYASNDIVGTFRPTTSDTCQKLAEVYREEHDGAPVPFSSFVGFRGPGTAYGPLSPYRSGRHF